MQFAWLRRPQPPAPVAIDLADVRERARELIAPGFMTFDEACAAARDHVDVGYEDDDNGRRVDTVVLEVWTERLAEQSTWTNPGDFSRVAAAFDDLGKMGILARMNFACCVTCGTAEIDAERTATEPDDIGYRFAEWAYTFFHMQDAEQLGDERADLYLSYSSFRPAPDLDPVLLSAAANGDADARLQVIAQTDQAVGRQITDTLRAHGLRVDWDGDHNQRIRLIDVQWHKPLPQ
ncbi:DUF6891 domain-containing protein [Rhodococcus sp. 27YEA15]|uniref:DUF6891 domain-containing protein n=1 Tax=Rhodococcus sp. 27YEA15 TaxID=3156259 RepID=UPI003C7C10C7